MCMAEVRDKWVHDGLQATSPALLYGASIGA
jgi:hypothetical protein